MFRSNESRYYLGYSFNFSRRWKLQTYCHRGGADVKVSTRTRVLRTSQSLLRFFGFREADFYFPRHVW
jgi:hypothetical protein